MPGKTSTRISMYFPHKLLEAVDGEAAQMGTNRSDLIRKAVGEYIKKKQEEILKQELIEGYKANAELLRQTSEDFKYVDGENI